MEETSWLSLIAVASTLLLIHIIKHIVNATAAKSPPSEQPIYGPKSYPIIGSTLSIASNAHRISQYLSDLLKKSPTHTIHIRRPFNPELIVTAHPANVEHILKTRFNAYPKGEAFLSTFRDLLGHGIFNSDGDAWRIQRKIASHEFNSRSLRKFVDTAVKSEISGRLLPLLAAAAAGQTVLDLQDVLQRFGFDNICRIAFGSDPGCLDPNLPTSPFSVAFDEAVRLIAGRFVTVVPLVWKLKRALRIGSEKKLRDAIRIIDNYAGNIILERKRRPNVLPEEQSSDLLSRFMSYQDANEGFVKDMIVSFILAGRDTTSSALVWFFLLISGNKRVEEEILREISGVGEEEVGFEVVKEMSYLHAAIWESMRLYPPVPFDSKQAAEDDVLPDGTVVKKGMRVMYHPYAMGRMESLWGKNWDEFQPERWLRKDEADGKWRLLPEDPYKFPVFQPGQRVCLGKDMAFIQMKSVAAAVLKRFTVAPAVPRFEPFYESNMTSKMKGGFPVRVELRKA